MPWRIPCLQFEASLQQYCSHKQTLPQIHAILVTTGYFLPSSRSNTTTFVYNCLINSYLRHGAPSCHALQLFVQMLRQETRPNSHTFPSLLKAAAASSASPSVARTIHAQTIRRGFAVDEFVGCCLVRFYAVLGQLDDAQQAFDEIISTDTASCNAMLDALCMNGDLGSAVRFFESYGDRDVVSWTAIINGFARNGCPGEAMELFRRLMHEEQHVAPNEATLVIALSACANLEYRAGGLRRGMAIHAHILRCHGMTASIGTAAVDMYGKHGHVGHAGNVFNAAQRKQVCTWNSMISALACNGREAEALDLFDRMRAESPWRPNHITFVAVLTACARAKLVEIGLKCFELMTFEFRLVPTMEHYGCMVDLLGRAGLLKEACRFMIRMPIEPDASVWGALLGACKVHGEAKLGSYAGKQLLALQPWHSGRYMVLSNVYAGAGRWVDAAELREDMKKAGVKKVVGNSWLDSCAASL